MTVHKGLFLSVLLWLTLAVLTPAIAQETGEATTTHHLTPYLDFGGGLVWVPSGQRNLTAFDQAVVTGHGLGGKIGLGVVVRHGPGPLLFDLGIEGYHDLLSPRRIINTLLPGSLDVEGYAHAYSLAPRIGISGEIMPGKRWYIGVGAGVAFQSLDLRRNGAVVLSGTGTTLMGHLDFGLQHEIARCIFLGAEAYANFYGGYDVRTSTNVASPFAPTVNAGVRAVLRFVGLGHATPECN